MSILQFFGQQKQSVEKVSKPKKQKETTDLSSIVHLDLEFDTNTKQYVSPNFMQCIENGSQVRCVCCGSTMKSAEDVDRHVQTKTHQSKIAAKNKAFLKKGAPVVEQIVMEEHKRECEKRDAKIKTLTHQLHKMCNESSQLRVQLDEAKRKIHELEIAYSYLANARSLGIPELVYNHVTTNID